MKLNLQGRFFASLIVSYLIAFATLSISHRNNNKLEQYIEKNERHNQFVLTLTWLRQQTSRLEGAVLAAAPPLKFDRIIR